MAAAAVAVGMALAGRAGRLVHRAKVMPVETEPIAVSAVAVVRVLLGPPAPPTVMEAAVETELRAVSPARQSRMRAAAVALPVLLLLRAQEEQGAVARALSITPTQQTGRLTRAAAVAVLGMRTALGAMAATAARASSSSATRPTARMASMPGPPRAAPRPRRGSTRSTPSLRAGRSRWPRPGWSTSSSVVAAEVEVAIQAAIGPAAAAAAAAAIGVPWPVSRLVEEIALNQR